MLPRFFVFAERRRPPNSTHHVGGADSSSPAVIMSGSSKKADARLSKRGDILPFAAPTYYPRSTQGNTVVLVACCAITAAVRQAYVELRKKPASSSQISLFPSLPPSGFNCVVVDGTMA